MIATLILFGIIFILIFKGVFNLHQQSTDWYGKNSIVKVSRSYQASFFSQSDIFYWLFILGSIAIFVLSFTVKNDLLAQIFVILIAFALFGIASFYFWIKYKYWQKNGKRNYIFDPVSKKLIIEGREIEEIRFDEIKEVIIYYPVNYKLVSGGYIKIFLTNETIIYLTSLSPCYDMLEEFFKGVKKQKIHKRIFSVN